MAGPVSLSSVRVSSTPHDRATTAREVREIQSAVSVDTLETHHAWQISVQSLPAKRQTALSRVQNRAAGQSPGRTGPRLHTACKPVVRRSCPASAPDAGAPARGRLIRSGAYCGNKWRRGTTRASASARNTLGLGRDDPRSKRARSVSESPARVAVRHGSGRGRAAPVASAVLPAGSRRRAYVAAPLAPWLRVPIVAIAQ